jgi:hypothetical protein
VPGLTPGRPAGPPPPCRSFSLSIPRPASSTTCSRHCGRQLADNAKARWPNLKILFTTGYARNAIVHHGRLDPGVELITKPFTATALAMKLRDLLEAE